VNGEPRRAGPKLASRKGRNNLFASSLGVDVTKMEHVHLVPEGSLTTKSVYGVLVLDMEEAARQ
jgi:hypothetical protein